MLELLHAKYLVFIAVLVYASAYVWRRVKEHRTITAFGGYACKAPSYAPFGFDVALRFVRGGQKHEDYKTWQWLFSHSQPASNKTAEFYIGGQRMVFTADPENIKAVLATQFGDYGKGESFHEDFKDFLGDGIFTTDGQQWSDSRNLLRPLFIKTRVRDFDIFEKHTARLIGMVGGRGEEVDISNLFYRYTLDTATDYLFGESVNSLHNGDSDFATYFNEVQRVQSLISRAGPFNRFVPRRTFNIGLAFINKYVNFFINRVFSLSASEKDTKEEGYTFLHGLARYTSSRKVMRDQLVSVLLAGRDTTAGTLSFLFYELSRHPEVVATLRKEILEKIGSRKQPDFEDLRNCSFLQKTISETLRLYPAVPYNIRVALKDTSLPHGGGREGLQPVGITKDTPIGYSVINLQYDPQHYPSISPQFPDVGLFCPERWNHWTPKPWTYLPFNGGPRICIGQQFALTEIAYTVVRMLQKFERIDRYWKDGEMTLKCEIVLSPARGVRVGFWEADSEKKI